MPALLTGLSAAVGLVGGALVPLTAYRLSVPATEPARAACASCGHPLRGGVSGWLRLPARCGQCRARLGPPAWLTAGVGAVGCGVLAAMLGAQPVLPMYLAAVVFGVLLAAIDVSCKRLPHTLVISAIGVTAAVLGVIAALTGDWAPWLRSVEAALVLGGGYLLLFLLPGQGVGFGDVKLAILLGLLLGWLGWGAVLLGGMLPWLVNGPVVIGLLVTRRIGRKSSVPFGPAMLAGTLLSVMATVWLQALGGH